MSDINPRVWVMQEGKNDYAPAETFGDVHFVTYGDYRNIPGSAQNKEVLADIRKFKSQYVMGTDYLIPSGNPMIAALVAMALPAGKHQFLKWDGRRAAYVPFILDSQDVNR